MLESPHVKLSNITHTEIAGIYCYTLVQDVHSEMSRCTQAFALVIHRAVLQMNLRYSRVIESC